MIFVISNVLFGSENGCLLTFTYLVLTHLFILFITTSTKHHHPVVISSAQSSPSSERFFPIYLNVILSSSQMSKEYTNSSGIIRILSSTTDCLQYVFTQLIEAVAPRRYLGERYSSTCHLVLLHSSRYVTW